MIRDISISFNALPLWVRVWVAVILVPVNLAPLAFHGQPLVLWVAFLSVGGMAPNLLLMMVERGFSKAMALGHLVFWTPLVVLLCWLLASGPDLAPGYRVLLWMVLMVDLVSLGFDYPDALKWYRGDRAVPGRGEQSKRPSR